MAERMFDRHGQADTGPNAPVSAWDWPSWRKPWPTMGARLHFQITGTDDAMP